MAKMKVHELAKELDIQSKDICQALSEKGVELKAQSAISDDDAQYIRNRFSAKKADAVKVNEEKESKSGDGDSKAKERPKRLFTTKGMVRPKGADGERKRRPRPEGERKRRPRPEDEAKPEVKAETQPKATEENVVKPVKKAENTAYIKQEEKVVTVTEAKSTTEVNKTEPIVNKEKPAEKVNEIPKSPAKAEEKKLDTETQKKVVEKPNTEEITPKIDVDKKQENTDKKEEKQMPLNQNDTRKVNTGNSYRDADNRNNGGRGESRRNDNRGNDRRNDNRNNDRYGNRSNDRNDNRNNDRYGNRNNDNRGYDRRNGDNRNNDRNDNRSNDRYGNRNNDRYGNRNNDNRGYDRRNGDNRNNDRNDNRNNDRFGNRNNDNRNSDRFGNRNNDNRNNDRRNGDNRNNDRRNDRRRNDSAPVADTVMADKDRKARENKLRQDKQDRNKKNYEDGQRGGRNGRGMQLQHKSMLQKPQKKKEEKKEEIKVITIPEVLTIGELAEKMKMQPSAVIKKLFLEGKMVTVNSEIDFATAEDIAMGYEIMCEEEEKVDVIEELLKEDAEDEETMVKRPPVVCVMGHVDHGKTSLLDAIKETNVISQEAGGITQHIGAYMVDVNGEKITFLDTPGHEAFTAMRMRGAQSTDIAILVVAADDGVMPQTVEAISHAKAAGIEIIVAINKIDKPGANIDRVKQELAEYELVAEDWGGNTIMVPVSAHTKEGIDTLLEMVILEADVLELKANPNRLARGLIIEAKLDKGKGSVATVLVQKGTLHVGDHIAAGSHYGRVRAMVDDKGKQVKSATPSTPVKILGLNGVPNAGEVLVSTDTGNEARNFAETFINDSREKLLEGTKYRLSLDDLNSQIEAGNLKELNLIIKADVQGSVEAIKQSMIKLSNDEVEVKVIHGGVGAINESDVSLAATSNAIIIGFNVKPDNQAQEVADREKVDVRLYSVIYNAIEDVESAMKGMLDPIFEEKVLGHAEIRQIFKASGVGNIAGSYVLDGTFERGCQVRITRDGEQIFEGPLASLKRFKDDVKEVKAGFECGLVFEKYNDIAEGDIVEAYKMVEVPR